MNLRRTNHSSQIQNLSNYQFVFVINFQIDIYIHSNAFSHAACIRTTILVDVVCTGAPPCVLYWFVGLSFIWFIWCCHCRYLINTRTSWKQTNYQRLYLIIYPYIYIKSLLRYPTKIVLPRLLSPWLTAATTPCPWHFVPHEILGFLELMKAMLLLLTAWWLCPNNKIVLTWHWDKIPATVVM